MVQSLVDKGEQGGFLPMFSAWNSYTAEMDGDHCISIIGDAWLKGIRGFVIEKAYAVMRKNAFESPATPEAYADGKGRRALKSYLKYGYIPLEDKTTRSFEQVLLSCASESRRCCEAVSVTCYRRSSVAVLKMVATIRGCE